MMHKIPLISIIIPTYNEEKYISACLDSILKSDYENEKMEIFVVDGMSNDGTNKIVQEYHVKYSHINSIENKQQHTPIGMNLGIRASRGEYLFIVSAHAMYEKGYFRKLIENIQKLNADGVGGVLITEVKNNNTKSSSIKSVLMNKFGVGNSLFRTGCSELTEVDTVAFGCYKKSTFDTYGLFDEKLIRNQDIELNKRIINGGGKIYLIPDVKCTYYARENFNALAKNNYSNGYWNILTAYYTKTFSSLSLRHFVPLLFVLSLMLPMFLSFIYFNLIWLLFLSLASYITLVIMVSLRLKNESNSLRYLSMSFLTLHVSYGIGSLFGIFSVVKKMIKGTQ